MPWAGIQGICKVWYSNKNADIRKMAIELMKICWEKKGEEAFKNLKNLDEAWKVIKGTKADLSRPTTSKGDSGKKGFKAEARQSEDFSKVSQFNGLSQSMVVTPQELKQVSKKIDFNLMI